MKKHFQQCSFEDAIINLPSQVSSIIMVVLPCITLWLHRHVMAVHPEVVAFLPILLTHASYLAIGVFRAISDAKTRDIRMDLKERLRYHMQIATFGAAPFGLLVILIGLLFRPIRPFAVIAAFSIILSTVIAVVFLATLTYLIEFMELKIELIGGPLAAASLFGVVVTTYMLTTRLMYRSDMLPK